MNIKTITTVDGVNVVDFGSAASRFYWIENLGSTTVYVSGNENIVPDGDNVKVLSAGCGTMVENLGGKVYILGAGKFQITNQGDKFPPFRNAPVADGGVMASGNPVQMDGLQEGVPFSEMVVSGKNLCDYPYFCGESYTSNGVVFTDNHDGSVTANGTATNGIGMYGIWGNAYPKTLPAGTYTISGCPKQGDDDIRYQVIVGTLTSRLATDSGSGATFTIDEPTAIVVRIYILTGKTADNVTFYPQLELGNTATAYEPPITGRELTVNVNGTDYTITPDSNPYTVPNDIRQQDGLNVVSVSEGEISVTGVRKNAAVKKIWDEIGDVTAVLETVTGGVS